MDFKAYNYSCLMAVLPHDVALRIRAFSLAIPDSDIYEIDDEEHGRPDEIHVSVKYGIHTSDPDEVTQVIVSQDMIRATLGSLTVFHNEDCIVLKVEVESKDIHELNRLISTNLKCTDTHPEYQPHVTVAYLRHREEDSYYYRKFFCGIFEGTEVWFDRLKFSTPAGDNQWISLAGNFGSEFALAAKMRRIANRVVDD